MYAHLVSGVNSILPTHQHCLQFRRRPLPHHAAFVKRGIIRWKAAMIEVCVCPVQNILQEVAKIGYRANAFVLMKVTRLNIFTLILRRESVCL